MHEVAMRADYIFNAVPPTQAHFIVEFDDRGKIGCLWTFP